MGVSSSPSELAAKLNGLARDMGNQRTAINATALHVKGLMQASAASAGVLGHRVARGRIGVNYRILSTGPHASAVVRYTGPAHLVDRPTRPHRIEPRRRPGSRRRRGARALTIGGNLRAWANHPGTAGKHFFDKARTVAIQTAPRVYAKAGLTAPLKRNF